MFLEHYKRPELFSIVSFSSIFVLMVGIPLVPRLSERFGKQKFLLTAISINLAIALFLLFVPIANPYVFMAIFIAGNIGQTFFTMLIWALVSDCLDYHEWKFDYRSDGSIYSIYTFSRKIGSTIASTLASYSLAWIGFVAGAATQSAQVSSNIRVLYIAVPVVASILEIIGLGFIFNLNQEKTEEVYSDLSARREVQ